MKPVVVILLLFSSLSAFAKCEPWTATLKFKMEGASYQDTVAWIGGWAASIDSISKDKNNGLGICTPECGYMISKAIADILNTKYEGKTISAETAAAAIWPQLKHRLVCKTARAPNHSLKSDVAKPRALG